MSRVQNKHPVPGQRLQTYFRLTDSWLHVIISSGNICCKPSRQTNPRWSRVPTQTCDWSHENLTRQKHFTGFIRKRPHLRRQTEGERHPCLQDSDTPISSSPGAGLAGRIAAATDRALRRVVKKFPSDERKEWTKKKYTTALEQNGVANCQAKDTVITTAKKNKSNSCICMVQFGALAEALSLASRLKANLLSPVWKYVTTNNWGTVTTFCLQYKICTCTLWLPSSFLYIIAGFLAFTEIIGIPCNQVAMNVHLRSIRHWKKPLCGKDSL